MAKSFSELQRLVSPRVRRMAHKRSDQMLQEMLLGELRKLSGKSQEQIAKAMGLKQSNLSRIERAGDMQISTLQRLIEAIGGQLRISIVLPSGQEARISQFDHVPSIKKRKMTA